MVDDSVWSSVVDNALVWLMSAVCITFAVDSPVSFNAIFG